MATVKAAGVPPFLAVQPVCFAVLLPCAPANLPFSAGRKAVSAMGTGIRAAFIPFFVTKKGMYAANKGMYAAKKGFFVAKKGMFVTNKGLFVANKGMYGANKGMYAAKKGFFIAKKGMYVAKKGMFVTSIPGLSTCKVC